MIKYIKKVDYFINGNFSHSVEIEKKSFYTVGDALEYLKNAKLKHYYNKKDISLMESAEVLFRQEDTFKKYYKIIDIESGLITTNIKEADHV